MNHANRVHPRTADEVFGLNAPQQHDVVPQRGQLITVHVKDAARNVTDVTLPDNATVHQLGHAYRQQHPEIHRLSVVSFVRRQRQRGGPTVMVMMHADDRLSDHHIRNGQSVYVAVEVPTDEQIAEAEEFDMYSMGKRRSKKKSAKKTKKSVKKTKKSVKKTKKSVKTKKSAKKTKRSIRK